METNFDRNLKIRDANGELRDWVANPVVRKLFEYWEPSGRSRDDGLTLRAAIRDGYMNLYANGQSVAKFQIRGENPAVSISQTYLDKIKKEKGRKPSPQTTKKLNELKADDVSDWIETALTFAGDEKRFVEDCVGRDPAIIDLEMAISTPKARSDNPDAKLIGRMDIIRVQFQIDRPQIAFWEAKCANNSEIRSRTEPKIFVQLRDYEDKLSRPEIAPRVSLGYQKAARILCDLCAIFHKGDAPEPWQRLARWEGPVDVVARPAVLIGNYNPESSTSTEDFVSLAETFLTNGHFEKLEKNFDVFPVKKAGDCQPLPNLPLAR